VGGHPVATWARRVADRRTASATAGIPAACSSSSTSRLRASRSTRGAGPAPQAASTDRAAVRTSARTRSVAAARRRAASTRRSRRSAMPSPVRALVASTGTVPRPSCAARRARSATHRPRSSAESRSAWLSTSTTTSACAASGRRYRTCSAASAYFCGSTTHTSRSTRSYRRSARTRCAVSTESWSGRSSSTSPVATAASPGGQSVPEAGASSTCRTSTSSQSSSACAPPLRTSARGGAYRPAPRTAPVGMSVVASAGHTAAIGWPVVGRRTPGTARSAPASALKSDDLPEPVDPASATTV
jgi:hypothetical protein